MTILSKTDIENLIKTRAPSISYAKSKRSTSEHCTNFSQVFVNCIAQNFICCSNCDQLLAWKSGDGSTNLKKIIKAAAEFCATDNPPFEIVQVLLVDRTLSYSALRTIYTTYIHQLETYCIYFPLHGHLQDAHCCALKIFQHGKKIVEANRPINSIFVLLNGHGKIYPTQNYGQNYVPTQDDDA
ncbi:unnamed protein product [Adineta steineri]|uniref:Uncharacterized protein n=1 Tax=Adineta steineri TaxID=433720 RepID=A0A814YBK2_9BILA|nr:unnamed protein product [Adineta steineri]CAF1517792.1 unnamed protein product [Adineta steineri]